MKKTEKLLNDIVEIYNNNPKVKKAADELLEAVAKPKIVKSTKVKQCKFDSNAIKVVANIKSIQYNTRETIIF